MMGPDNQSPEIVETSLARYRAAVQAIDHDLLDRLIERIRVTEEIGALKDAANLPLTSPDVESIILDNLRSTSAGRLGEGFLKALYTVIFEESKIRRVSKSTMGDRNIAAELRIRPLIIAGPCTVESETQIQETSADLAALGVRFLRGGSFKPRTDPRSFQGLGVEGLLYHRRAASANGQYVVSEVLDKDSLERCYSCIDVIQVGSRNMSSYGFLKQIGQMTANDKKPILLKRGMGSTISEFQLAAEHIAQYGNENIILCLRGIRTFEQADSSFRFTPDLASILELKERSQYPVIYDPSHAAGKAKYVCALAEAALSLGADGLIIECHRSPADALVDGRQSITPDDLGAFLARMRSLHPVLEEREPR